MRKSSKRVVLVSIMLVFLLSCTIVYAASDTRLIQQNEILTKSQFIAASEINNEGTIKGDLYSAGESVSSKGTVEGDFVSAGNSVSSNGTVSGDVICAGSNVSISGNVSGNLRCGASNAIIDGSIMKNVMLFANTIDIKSGTQIGGNLLAMCSNIRIEGNVKGGTRINANTITLSGEFFGDVDINLDIPNSSDNSQSRLTILPGTTIHGKLTYKGSTEADIQNGAQINEQEWIKTVNTDKTYNAFTFGAIIKSLLSHLSGAALYFLLAMLLFKLFPVIFKRQDEIVNRKPLTVIGTGLTGLVSIIGIVIAFIILLILSALLMSPGIGIMLGLVTIMFYAVLVYLSTIPVSLWLGNLLLADRYNIPFRFATGLGIITITLFITGLLAKLPVVGFAFSIITFLVVTASLIIGIGALLFTIKELYTAAKKAGAEEEAI